MQWIRERTLNDISVGSGSNGWNDHQGCGREGQYARIHWAELGESKIMEQAMGQGAKVQGVIYGSKSNGRINGWRKLWLLEQSKEHEWYKRWIKEHNQRRDGWMQAMGQGTIDGTMIQRVIVGAMDQWAIKGAMDQREMIGAMDQEAIEGTMFVTSNL